MLSLEAKRYWAFVVKILLFYGTLPQSSGNTCQLSTITSSRIGESQCQLPSGFSWCSPAVCLGNTPPAAFCQTGNSRCSITIMLPVSHAYNLTLNKDILSTWNIVVVIKPDQHDKCISLVYNKTDFFFLNGYGCMGANYAKDDFCDANSTQTRSNCSGFIPHDGNLTIDLQEIEECVKSPDSVNNSPPGNANLKKAEEVMHNISAMAKAMVNTTEEITIGNITGVITKLQTATSISVGITTTGEVKIIEDNDQTSFSCLVYIPAEATAMALNQNGTFAAVVLFPNMHQDDPKSFFLNNKILGIEMGAGIHNLSQTIHIQYNNVDKNGNIASCRSWNGTGDPVWITDGCNITGANGSITCQCSHLTFFALLMSSPPTNISSSDYTSLTYITSIGCGLSIFFLVVALFMHCFIRKGKANQATKILMNLFTAMLILNLSFLLNESIADLDNPGACVVTAAVMHYTMLATFSWFFVEALHIYFNLWTSPNEVKHYMIKIGITGWGTPAIVVIVLLALKKYSLKVIYTDDGNSSKMCWISDAFIEQGVNVGYYAIVFIFTFGMFILTVREIVLFKPAAGKAQHHKTQTFSIMGLFFLLGITWAFAFFSYGPLLIPSYYIFTILNSFQGFFLFIYYYNTSKMVGDDTSLKVNHSGEPTSKTVESSCQ